MLLMWLTMVLSSGPLSRMGTSLFLSLAFPQPPIANANSRSTTANDTGSTNSSTGSSSSDGSSNGWVASNPELVKGNSSSASSGLSMKHVAEAAGGPSLMAGTYDYLSSHNFEEYLQELGVGFVLRRLASLASPSVTVARLPCNSQQVSSHQQAAIQQCGGQNKWTITTDTIFRSHHIEFELGVPFVDTTMDGRRVLVRIDETGQNEWTEVQRPCSQGNDPASCPVEEGNRRSTTLVRTFLADRMQVDMKVGEVRSSSVFLRRLAQHQHHEEDDFDAKFKST